MIFIHDKYYIYINRIILYICSIKITDNLFILIFI